MILRRFMKHVSDQNWFAVGLDVLVVITGIFLGMQVTDWNEERKDRIEDINTLDLFSKDISGMVVDIRSDLDMSVRQVRLIWQSINLSRSCDSDADGRAAIKRALHNSMFRRSPEFRSSGLEAITTPGVLGRIDDPDFSNAVGRYEAEVEWFKRFQEQTIHSHREAFDHIISHMARVGPMEIDETGLTPVLKDFGKSIELPLAGSLCKDEHFRSDLFTLARAMDGSVRAHSRLLKALLTVQENIERIRQ